MKLPSADKLRRNKSNYAIIIVLVLTNSPLSVAKLFELSQIRTLSPTLCQLKPDPTFNSVLDQRN